MKWAISTGMGLKPAQNAFVEAGRIIHHQEGQYHPLWLVAYNIDSLREKCLAASLSLFSLTIESTRVPSRSLARER